MPGPDDGDHVEAGCGRLRALETRKEHRSRANDTSLLARIDRLCRRKEGGAGAIAHFDEDEMAGVSHDEIDFAAAAAKIAANETKPASLEKTERASLSECA